MRKLAFVFALLILAIPCKARIITVDDNGPADFNNIKAAINAAVTGDEVLVAPGTYTGAENQDTDFLGKAITVRSQSGPENCIIDCNATIQDQHRGFHFHSSEDSNSILEGFTIIRGYISQGAGISCEGSDPFIKNCIISNNAADMNGQGGYGGGIYCYHSNPIIANCIISDNRVVPSHHHYGINGGGVYCLYSQPIVSNCLIINNSAKYGGGIYCQSSGPHIINCTFAGNSAEKGGAVYCTYWSVAWIDNSILWTNTANWGNEIYLSNWFGSFPSKVIASYSDIPDGFGNVSFEWDCTMEWRQGNIHTDPCFVFTDDFRLMPASTCIDTGDPNYVAGPNETDLDGNPRVVDGNEDGIPIVDMGAYEWMPPTPAELIAWLLEEVEGLELPGGIENSLMAKLNSALGALEDENENNDVTAINTLEAFINVVEAQRGKKILEAEADDLIAAAQQIINLLSDG